MRISLPLLASLAFVALPACSSAASGEDDAPAAEGALHHANGNSNSESVTLTDADDGKTVSVAQGKDLTVTLGSNPTTGFSWKVVSTNRTFGYPSPKDGTFEGGGDGPIGSGGKQVFTWKTSSPILEPGSTEHAVKLEYRRSFESDDIPAAKTFEFKVRITEP